MGLKSLILIISIFLTGFTNDRQQYPGTNLRGRVVTLSYKQEVPLVSARVDLYYFNPLRPPGAQWIQIASTLTDAYGFYYFKQITPKNYVIWINRKKSYNIHVVAIDRPHYVYQDLPQFVY